MTETPQIETIGEDEGERTVTVLELFFDLVFVLAITQVTSFFAEHQTGRGFAEGLIVLALVWWSWVGYSWLTNAVDIDDPPTRVAFFVAMAGFVVVALATPKAFGDDGLAFACAYGVVRLMQPALYARGVIDRPKERAAIIGLLPGFLGSVTLLVGGAVAGGDAQLALWALAVVVDFGGPLVFSVEGFHGLARDSYSYIHFFMIAGIVLSALGIKTTLAHTGAELDVVPAIALCAGPALYLTGHVLFRRRNRGTSNRQRIVATIVLLALIPVARSGVAGLLALTLVTAVLVALVTYEMTRFREARDRMRAASA